MSSQQRNLKRIFDLLVAVPLLAILSPVWAVLGAVIKVTDRGPSLYRARRVGQGGEEFLMYKFRTMVTDADKIGGASTGASDPRITRVGHFMRRWKLDEIPQLWNVVRGDMSLVGPRPTLGWDVARYTEDERRLLDVRPGITDWASIRFRDEGEILRDEPDPDEAYDRLIRPEKVKLGLLYVERSSVAEDLRILVATGKAVAGRQVSVPSVDLDGVPPFHRVTESWSTPANPEQWQLSSQRYSLTAALADGKDLLEIGCGTGYGLARCREHTRSAVGLDIDERNLELARRQAIECTFVLGSAERLPFDDDAFDVVAGLEMYYYLSDQARFLAEVARVLRPAGRLLITLPNADRPAFSASPMSTHYPSAMQLDRELRAAGFTSQIFGSGVTAVSSPARELARRALVRLRLIPRTIEGRARLKSVVFRNMRTLATIDVDPGRAFDDLVPIRSDVEARRFAIIVAIATAGHGVQA